MSKQIAPVKKNRITKQNAVLLSVVGLVLVAAMVLSVIFIVVPAVNNYQTKAFEQTAVGSCAGYDIPYEELRYVANHYSAYLEQIHGKGIWDTEAPDEAYVKELESLVMENLNSTYAVYKLCEHLGVATESKEINAYVDKKMTELKNSDSFGGDSKKVNAWLKENHMTEHLLEETLKGAYLESLALNAMIESGQQVVYSTENLDEFLNYVEQSPDYARTLHVFIANKQGEYKPTDDAMRRAKEICSGLRGESDFQARFDLLKKYIQTDSNDYQMTTLDGYYFTKDEMDLAYEEATFDLAIGDVSDPVVTDDGVYVIMRLQPEATYIMTNYDTLLQNYQGAVLGRTIETVRSQYKAELNDYGKSLTLWALE